MAMASRDDVKDRTRNTEMQKILLESRQQHELIAEQIHKLLDSIGTGEKDPSPMARAVCRMLIAVEEQLVCDIKRFL